VRDFSAGPCELLLDPDQFQSALYNLFLNALQAMNGQGELRIGTRSGPAGVEIVVADTGPGLPDELLPLLFEPFVSAAADGSGLGLAIVKTIIEAHGGTVTAEPGRPGAVFRVQLPAG